MPEWKSVLRASFAAGGHDLGDDIIEELNAHAETAYESARADGCDAAEARRRVDALIDAWTRDAESLRRRPTRAPAVVAPSTERVRLAGIIQDVRYGMRLLRRQPGFAATAALTMALSIGATTTLWSVVDGVLLKPLPWPEADRLVRVTETRDGRTGRVRGTLMNGTFLAWADRPATIDALAGWLRQTRTLTVRGGGEPSRVPVIPLTPSAFAMLSARPLVGRLFAADEGARGAPGVALLSYGLWQEQFGGRPDVVGEAVQLDDQPYTIVGVMPRTFAFPDREARLWTAWTVPGVIGEKGVLTGVIFSAMARLRPGATLAQAAAEATVRARAGPDASVVAMALFGAKGPIDVHVTPARDALTADVRPAMLVLLAAVALLLVTATANVASLQLARATTRRRELAVRASLGAGQPRLVRQLLVESAIVGLSGGVAGLGLAVALLRILPSMLPVDFPRLDAVTIDMRVLAFAVAVSLATSVICGMIPAWHLRRLNLVETLAEDGVAPVGGSMRLSIARTRACIMAGQVAVACVLLVGAALLTRSFVALLRADRGYDPVNVLTARLPLPAGYAPERRIQLLDTLIARLRVAPGVTHAAYSTALPFVSAGGFAAFTMRSPRNPGVEMDVQATQRVVSPDYFAAMRLRLVAGRTLLVTDTSASPPAIVVNQSFARKYLGDHPIGFHIPQRGGRAGLRFHDARADWEVVGVVDDMRQDSVEAPLQPELFASFAQMAPDGIRNLNFDPILVIRTATDPVSHVPALRALVREEAPAAALDSVMTMEDRVMTSLAKPRLYAVVLAGFAVFALLIAGVGLFGVLSYSVALRTREIGVRTALGAQARDIVWLVLRQAAVIAVIGIVVGLWTSFAASRYVSAFLYGVDPHDAVSFGAVSVLLVVVTVVACIVPARRAASVDPLQALRVR
jgi:predicted permease